MGVTRKLSRGRGTIFSQFYNFASFADECASVTCLNYGDHERLPATCQCACRAGFSGDSCQTGVDPQSTDIVVGGRLHLTIIDEISLYRHYMVLLFFFSRRWSSVQRH